MNTNKTTCFSGRLVLVLLAVSVFSSLGFAEPRTRTEWVAEYEQIDSSLGGSGYSSSSDSATLAWRQGNILHSYLNMYEATLNTNYLESFTSQFDTMIGTMEDADGDGYDGWDTDQYSVDVAQNGGAEDIDPTDISGLSTSFTEDFETPHPVDGTLPDGWERYNEPWWDPTGTMYLDSGNAYEGSYGLTVETEPSTGWQILQRTLSYVPDAVYLIKFRGKISGTAGPEGMMVLHDFTDSQFIASVKFDGSNWEEKTLMFRAPSASGNDLKIRLYQSDWSVSGFNAHFDDIKIYRVDNQKLLPEHWIRSNSTSNTAYIGYTSSTDSSAGHAGFKLESDPGSGDQMLQSPLNNLYVADNPDYEPGIKYTVRFSAKASGSIGWKMDVYDLTASQLLVSRSGSNTGWTTFETSFTAPTAVGHDVQVRLYPLNPNTAGSAHFDEIEACQYAEYAVHDGMVAAPVSRFIMMANRGLVPASYQSSANTFLGVLEDHIFPNWDFCLQSIDGSRSVYTTPDDGSFSSPSNSLPHNQYLALTAAYAFLSRADLINSVSYATLAGKLGNAFFNELALQPDDSYEWDYWDALLPGDDAPWGGRPEDTSHGNADIQAAIACQRAGVAFDGTDLARFANAYTLAMWDGDTVTPEIDNYVDGTSGSTSYQHYMGDWIMLGEHDSQIYDIVKTLYEDGWDSYDTAAMRSISEIVMGYLALNETFETPDAGDSTLPEGWTRYLSTPATAYLDSGNAFEGGKGLTIETDGGTWRVLETPLTDYRTNCHYQIRAMGKKSGNPAVDGRLEVYDYTTSKVLGTAYFADTDWKLGVIDFTSPSVAGRNIRIRLYTSSYTETDGVVHFDNVEVRTGLDPGGPTALILR